MLEPAVDIWGERRRRIGTGELNRLVAEAIRRQSPPMVKGRRPKIFYATQVAVAPPTFVFFAKDAGSVHFSYQRYLENQIREAYGFDGTPIRIFFRERSAIELPRRSGRGRKASGGSTARPRPSTKPSAKPATKAPSTSSAATKPRGR